MHVNLLCTFIEMIVLHGKSTLIILLQLLQVLEGAHHSEFNAWKERVLDIVLGSVEVSLGIK